MRLTYASLISRVAGAAEEIRAITVSPRVIGLLGGNRVDSIVGQLAAWHAGMTVVPLPSFFRVPQLQHVIQDAGIAHVLCCPNMIGTARLLGVPFTPIPGREARVLPPPEPGAAQIVYTSGSTGRPKGVVLDGAQLLWSADALASASGARADDAYLSLLPLELLLETICAVIMPVFVGATARLVPGLTENFGQSEVSAIAETVAAIRPTCTVLVPHLLAAWVRQLENATANAPDSLRFVAVGGGPVPATLAARAWEFGIPVHEGYGLSECSSVVALNRHGERRSGTVGRPLPGLDVRIERREIVVRGASVMRRYLHGPSTKCIWRTGDVGHIDADGFLTVHGRADNVIVTSMGRNVSPEWIESLVAADPRIEHCVVHATGGAHLGAILVPTPDGEEWFERASDDAIGTLVRERCRDAPDYAVPREPVVIRASELVRFGLLTRNGRVRRKALLEEYAGSLGIAVPAPASIQTRSARR